MPGLYTEPTARDAKTFDPGCERYKRNTEFGDPGALSYAYHVHCPNDQNLIAVIGRATGSGTDPDPPNWNRHGIPNIGPCVRCNLQLEGSGVSADDVIVDAGNVEAGNKGPHKAKKDVAIRADRADGFVLRNITARHAKEHGIYVIETDGYLLDRFKAFYNGLYGTLTFVEDHGVQQNCETVGHPDSGIYPGAALESGVQRPEGTEFRYNQEIRWCDSHHNLAGYSGTDGNAVYVHDNNFYDNALGIQTDIATAAGHPGFPGDSMLVERNNIYSNNFNPYDPGSDVEAAFPFPVGTGMWIAGGNHHTVRRNFIYDNWRRGTMVFSIPDALVCGPVAENEQAGCSFTSSSTSHYNQQYDNVMGRAPDGRTLPNGTDFWWDSFPGNRGNCWYWNRGPAPITSSPSPVPNCANGSDPAMSIGLGNVLNEIELLSCLAAFETRNFDQETSTCPWLRSPPRPGSGEQTGLTAKQRALGARSAGEVLRAQQVQPDLPALRRLAYTALVESQRVQRRVADVHDAHAGTARRHADAHAPAGELQHPALHLRRLARRGRGHTRLRDPAAARDHERAGGRRGHPGLRDDRSRRPGLRALRQLVRQADDARLRALQAVRPGRRLRGRRRAVGSSTPLRRSAGDATPAGARGTSWQRGGR